MKDLIVGVGAVAAVFSVLYMAFEPVLAPALTSLLGVLK